MSRFFCYKLIYNAANSLTSSGYICIAEMQKAFDTNFLKITIYTSRIYLNQCVVSKVKLIFIYLQAAGARFVSLKIRRQERLKSCLYKIIYE